MKKYVSTFGFILGLLCSQADAKKQHQDDYDVSKIVNLAESKAKKFLAQLEQPSSWSCVSATESSEHTLKGLKNFWQLNEHTSRSKGRFPKGTDTEEKRDIYRAAFIWQTNEKLKDKDFDLFFSKTQRGKHKIFAVQRPSRGRNGTSYTGDTLESVNLNSDVLWNTLLSAKHKTTKLPYHNETLTLYSAEAFVAAYLGTSNAEPKDQWTLAQKFFPNLEDQIKSAQFDNLSSAAVNTDHLKQILSGTLEPEKHPSLEEALCNAITEQKENNLGTQQKSTEALQDMVTFAINLTQAQGAKVRS